MRLTFTACMRGLFLLVPLFLCTILFANDNQDGEKITLSEKAVALKTVFKKITLQTGIKFVYSNRLIDDEQKVDVSVRNANLEEVMQQIFAGKKFELQRTGAKSVVIVVHEKVVSSVAPVNDVAIIDVSGTVSDVAGEKLPGATVQVRGMNKATMTDGEGRFRLLGVLANARLLVSYTGYTSEEIKLEGQRELSVRLRVGENRLSEVVVAYGTTTQRANTGAVTVVKGEQIQSLPNRSFDKSLQGLVPGLQISNGTGQPGGGVSNMVLRGIATGADPVVGTTVRNPLIVIDGIPATQDHFQISITVDATPISNSMAQLNPSDIESISVLKDAAAIALYGSKASNGVILVTTKRGKEGKIVFGIRSQTDVSYRPAPRMSTLNQQEYLDLLFETYKNTNPSQWTDQAIRKDLYSKFPVKISGTDTSFYDGPDWISALYNNMAITTSNELSISGGNEKSNFYLSLEYTKQDGIVKSSSYDRKSFRFNYDRQANSWLKLGTNTMLSYNIQNYVNPSEGVVSYAAGAVMSPLNPIRLEDGNYIPNYSWGVASSAVSSNNPVATAEYNTNKNIAYRGVTSIKATAQFLKYFTLSSNVGVDFMLVEAKEKIDPRFRLSSSSEFGSINERDRRRANIINTNILRFDRNIYNNHKISILLGEESQVISERSLGGEVRGTKATQSYYDDISSPGYIMKGFTGNSNRQTLFSLFGQGNYSYDGKYLLSASIRRDGSSKFGAREQWGTYWSIGSGWIVTEETGVKSTLPWLSYLKIRGSIGAAGNSGAIAATTRYDQLSVRTYQGGNAAVSLDAPGNPYIRWEKTFTWDVGLEIGWFNGRLSGTADIYHKRTKDLVYTIPLSTLTGYYNVMDNIGDMNNKGIELSVTGDVIKTNIWKWTINANWSTNQNILVKANVPLATVTGTFLGNEEGRNFNSFYLRKWAGVNQEDGKPQWIDSTGKKSSIYNAAKREFVGKPQPDGFGAITNTISYKGVTLAFQLYYQYGFQLYNMIAAQSILTDGSTPYINQTKDALNRWQTPGDIALNPRRRLNNTDGGNGASTRYLFDGDYIRLQYVQLSYAFSKKTLSHIHLDGIRLFLQGNNLALWTKYPYGDPDNVNAAGRNGYAYPNAQSLSIGLNINF